MKTLFNILFLSFSFILIGGGDYLITTSGEKVEVKRLQVRKNQFKVRLEDRTTKIFKSSEVDSYYDSENDAYFEKLDVKEKTQFCKVVLSDGVHKIIIFKEKIEYGGGQIYFEDMYYFKGKQCMGVFTKKNHIEILKNFDTCSSFQRYLGTKKRWFSKLDKLEKYLKSKCQGA